MAKDEPREVLVQSPGGKWEEQVAPEGARPQYAVYSAPTRSMESIGNALKEIDPEERKAAIVDPSFRDRVPCDIPEMIEYKSTLHGDSDNNTIRTLIPLPKCPWALPGEPAEPDDIYGAVRSFIFDHVCVMDPRIYDLLTAWVLASWVPECFEVIPYFFFLGPKASGKTRALEVLKALSRRAVLGSNVTEAALYMLVEAYGCTLLLDETERYTKEKFDTVQNLLNSGYRRGGIAVRGKVADGGERVIEYFDVFGFKALAGTEGMLDTLESRSIRVYMTKATRRLRFLIDRKRARELRSRLLMWRWRTLQREDELRQYFEEQAPEILSFGEGRFVELFAALYTIAPEARVHIISYARDQLEKLADEENNSIESEVAIAVFKCRDAVEKGRVGTADILRAFNADKDASLQISAKALRGLLKRLGFNNKRTVSGAAGVIWDEELLKSFAVRYSLDEKLTEIKLNKGARTLDSIKEESEQGEQQGEAEAPENTPGAPAELDTPEATAPDEGPEDRAEQIENVILGFLRRRRRVTEYTLFKELMDQGFKPSEFKPVIESLKDAGLIGQDPVNGGDFYVWSRPTEGP